ncbi:MAG: hypothetical protein IJR20_07300 [Muribaculaceae bacterium]|nr:hypothetical protein [Muribaculaceae bacterium]
MARNLDKSELHFAQDERLSFKEEGHIYLLDGKRRLTAVSSVIGRYFKPFDSDYWARRKARSLHITAQQLKEQWECEGMMASLAGTHLHKQIEGYLNGDEHMVPTCRFAHDGEHVHVDKIINIDKEIELFLKFAREVDFTPFRTEWRVMDEELGMAGTIDLTCSRRDGTFELYDWKRSRSLIDEHGNVCKTSRFNSCGINGLEHIADCSYWHYALQQNLYKLMVEKCYGLKISAMHLVVLHHSYDTYHVIEIPDMPHEIDHIVNELMQKQLNQTN